MNYKFFLGIGVAVAIVIAGAAVYTGFAHLNLADSAEHDTLYQVSTISALMQGVYDGTVTVAELKKHGDFGIGTFDRLDGEMIVLDGQVWQAKADGTVVPAADDQTTPFATVTCFSPDIRQATPDHAMNLSEFATAMAAQLPSQNMIYAVEIHGTFPSVTVRAIPGQEKPYPNMTVAAAGEKVHTYANVTGTVVGFYTPVFIQDLNTVGYHLHFLSDDHTMGGHILDMTVPANSSVEYDITPYYTVALPTSGAFTGTNLTANMSGAVAAVEQ
ncbi:MAG: acetolactate decarboxylase [Methanoregula sp.]|uniref:acetolactate decarboxylase n=2 Tax=Methanoregula sp. TaxID=2052170 RepID=UPI003C5021A4